MASRDDLAASLRSMDGAGYGRYRSLSGRWDVDGVDLEVLRVQADPFAPPSRVRLTVADGGLPADLSATPDRRRALASFLLRELRAALRGTPVTVDAGGPEVLDRGAGTVRDDGVVVLEVGVPLPGPKRRVLGREAAALLGETLPGAVRAAVHGADHAAARAFVETVEDAVALRAALAGRGLVGFVADGAVLPRRSGVDDRPLDRGEPGDGGSCGATPFAGPSSLRVTLEAPHAGPVSGTGVPEGVTLIVGGGYHGKSTLLRALEAGVYDHMPGDGREQVVTRPDAVKLRAEDGRAVTHVDVSAFVAHLPASPSHPPRSTDDFSTTDASGSTSQAASTVEALEAGADVLLIDEDTSATNMMIRDARMQQLIVSEPLVPFVDRVRPLYAEHGVSTVLVMGGSGDYLGVADTVIMMDAYRAFDVTARAHEIAASGPSRAVEHTGFPAITPRVVDPASLDPTSRGRRRVTARGRDLLTFGDDDIDLSAVDQIADRAQVAGIGRALALLGGRDGHGGVLDGTITLSQGLDLLDAELDRRGTDALFDGRPGDAADVARPRRHEVAAALNRLRSLRLLLLPT